MALGEDLLGCELVRTTIVEYTEQMIDAVVQFNRRLKSGGVETAFPTSHVPPLLPRIAARRLFQEYCLAVDEDSAVRGGYILKHQDFFIGGRTVSIADFQLPLSEGIVNSAFPQVGVQLLLDAQTRQPLLFGLGMGAEDEALPRLLKAAGWVMSLVPFYFRIVRPFAFLRNISYLRHSALKRVALDVLAFSGLGWSAVKGLQALRYRPAAPDNTVDVQPVDEFHDWADDLWERCKPQYRMSAVRDSEVLQILYPKDEKKFSRLKLTRRQQVIGWAVLLDTRLCSHKQFGNMRLGSIVDCFSSPEDAGTVINAARRLLEERGVDLIVSNQSHAAWCRALGASGFMRGPSNFIFTTSRKLTELLETAQIGTDDVHLNRGDGDGPINL